MKGERGEGKGGRNARAWVSEIMGVVEERKSWNKLLTNIRERDTLHARGQPSLIGEREPGVLVVDPDLVALVSVWLVADEEEV